MEIKERIVQNPNRRQIKKIEDLGDGTIIADITDEQSPLPGQEGTIINAELLNSINWRSNKSVSFKVMTLGDVVPESKADEVQIFTDADGCTWLLPAGVGKTPIEIGRTQGTKVTVDGSVTDIWNSDTKQDKLTNQQMQNINDVPGKLAAPENPTVPDAAGAITGTTIPVLSPVQGAAPHKKSINDFVRFDINQNKAPEEKTIARANINAASPEDIASFQNSKLYHVFKQYTEDEGVTGTSEQLLPSLSNLQFTLSRRALVRITTNVVCKSANGGGTTMSMNLNGSRLTTLSMPGGPLERSISAYVLLNAGTHTISHGAYASNASRRFALETYNTNQVTVEEL